MSPLKSLGLPVDESRLVLGGDTGQLEAAAAREGLVQVRLRGRGGPRRGIRDHVLRLVFGTVEELCIGVGWLLTL